MQPLSETRCQHLHVRSNAASMRHTVSESDCIPYLLLVNGTAVETYMFWINHKHPDMKPVLPNQDTQSCHPWRLDRRIPAADGLYLTIPVSCPHICIRFKS